MNHRIAGAVAVFGAALLLTACGSADPAPAPSADAEQFKQVAQDPAGEITVWADATRVPVVEAYQKAHPEAKIKLVTYSGNANGATDLQTKVQLFDRTGSGWPDVAFSTTTADTAWAAFGAKPYAAPVDKVIDQSVLSGFSPGALDPCKVGENVYCVRNDLAQVVLWYNKKLLDEFGYQVPTTWEEYQTLGEKVATEHPGYLVGTAGDPWMPEIYLWASQCPASTVTEGKNVTVDLKNEKCTRAVSMIDTLIKAGSMSKSSVFDAGFIKDKAAKLLMAPGPSWYGQVLFNATFKIPKGEIAAAAPLKYAADSETFTGNVGGGVWYISSHSKNLKTAADLVSWVTTSDEAQGNAGTYPAFQSAATLWLSNQQATGYFAQDIAPAFTTAAKQVWPGWSATQYSHESIYASTVVPALNQGQTITSTLDAWQTAIKNKAATLGYKVS
ncbi:ABC transporter substrate-binding protein [Acrocarpospora phusangensis]|uniref:ABC transporter substrate-binding protein n=1 Tax=Acrocarpospora phusangensis TaxID=1070424 RepID=A0A919Q7S6_9ACTN|nr:extracellular solute-binding protein [Acrocarpospora phusangensis]GIH22779.1 ABC transporter substrate-binding protein [Acrocarpospora phusangensis]